tara:strand:- start:1206 stop:1580 length:375 start_codon:yes stop_codon:yes gene_type:complete
MADGRHFTNYEANNSLNSKLRYENNLVTGADYRSYLTQNAVKLMNMNSQEAWAANGCGPCKNLCLGIDESKRPGNSTQFEANSCIPPDNFQQYTGSDPKQLPMNQPEFTRVAIPSGAVLTPPKK